MKRLNEKEIQKVEKLYTSLCEAPENCARQLEVHFPGNADHILEAITSGVDKFYDLYKQDIDPKTIQDLMGKNMQGMTDIQCYKYFSNLMLALTHVCGAIVDDPEWNTMLEEHQTMLKAIEMGLVTEDSKELWDGLEEMRSLILANITEFSVLFIGEPPYEALVEACKVGDAASVQALAVNTRESAVNMAASLYILQESGELHSLGNNRIPPEEMGVMAASLLEIDAAVKSGVWETAKDAIEKAARTAVLLIVTSPEIVKDVVCLSIVALLTNFSLFWMLIAGAVLFINTRVHQRSVEEYLEPVFNVGAKVLSTALEQAEKISCRFTEWIQTTVIPTAVPVWERCRDFTVQRLLLPAGDFLLRAKETVLSIAGIAYEKIQASMTWLRERAQNLGEQIQEYHTREQSGEAEIEIEDTAHTEMEVPEKAEDTLILT